mmetsp:Transcript_7177/g.14946  ORF Transcript_7177/g.14946 Transcript_7177/m.14946 type:complete len:233 (+) Transcript_7177:1167-1865(+)
MRRSGCLDAALLGRTCLAASRPSTTAAPPTMTPTRSSTQGLWAQMRPRCLHGCTMQIRADTAALRHHGPSWARRQQPPPPGHLGALTQPALAALAALAPSPRRQHPSPPGQLGALVKLTLAVPLAVPAPQGPGPLPTPTLRSRQLPPSADPSAEPVLLRCGRPPPPACLGAPTQLAQLALASMAAPEGPGPRVPAQSRVTGLPLVARPPRVTGLQRPPSRGVRPCTGRARIR